MTAKILDRYLDLLERNNTATYAFSDVFPPHGRWGTPDFDAELTTEARSLFLPAGLKTYGIGRDPQTGLHAAQLLAEMKDVRQKKIAKLVATRNDQSHIRSLQQAFETTAVHGILNVAPRSSKTGENGTNFYLAITDNDVALWVTPLQLLELLATSRRITALFKVPNRDNPVFPNGEQFRSSVVPAFRFYPESLIPIFQYETREELVQAIADGVDIPLPTQKELLKTVWTDAFGNIRAHTPDIARLQDIIQKNQRDTVVGIRITGEPLAVRAQIRSHLSDIDDGELGIFINPADAEFACNADPSGSIELVRKVRDPNHPCVASARTILDILSGYKPARAGTELEIIAPQDAFPVAEVIKVRNGFFRRAEALWRRWQETTVL